MAVTFWKGTLAQYTAKKEASELIDSRLYFIEEAGSSNLLGSLYKGETLIAPQRLAELTSGTTDEDKVPTAKAVADFVATFFADGSAYDQAIKGLNGRMDNAEGRLDTAEGDINGLKNRMGTAETTITDLGTNKANKADVYTKEEISNMLSSALEFKGTVDTAADLPETGETGDLYYVKEDSKEYVYVGGGDVDPYSSFTTDSITRNDGTLPVFNHTKYMDEYDEWLTDEFDNEAGPGHIYAFTYEEPENAIVLVDTVQASIEYITRDITTRNFTVNDLINATWTDYESGEAVDITITPVGGSNTGHWEELGGVVDYSVFVQKTTKVNGKALSEDITLTGDDIKVGTFDPEGAVTTIGGETTLSGAIKALDEAISGVTGGSGGEGGSLASKMDKVSADSATQVLKVSSTGNAEASGYTISNASEVPATDTASATKLVNEKAVAASLKALGDTKVNTLTATQDNILVADGNGGLKDSACSISSAETIADVANASATKLVNEKAVAVALANATIEWIEG